MALLKFSRGEFKSLPTTRTEGHVYITTDEKAMYVDISNSERIRIGQIIELSAQEWTNLQPPYSTEAFYYIGGDYNALLKWTGSAWVQINSTKAVQDQFTALSNRITKLDEHFGVNRNDDGSVINSTISTQVSTNTAAITQLQTGVSAAKDQADKGVADAAKAQEKANAALARSGGTMTGDITMSAGTKIILPEAAPAENTHAANKKYVDDTVNSAKTTLQGSINDVSTVATRADNQSKDNLATLTNETTGLAAAHAKAKQGIDNAKKAQDDVDALEGVVGAGFEGTTLTAKITAIEGVNTTQGTAISDLQEKVKNVSNVMDFAGVVTAKPADGAAGYHKGDVVVVVNEDSDDNGKEFVYDGTKWYEFGNSDATIAALGELGERLDEVEGAIETADTGILARLTAVEGVNADQNTSINTILSALTWGTF